MGRCTQVQGRGGHVHGDVAPNLDAPVHVDGATLTCNTLSEPPPPVDASTLSFLTAKALEDTRKEEAEVEARMDAKMDAKRRKYQDALEAARV